MVVHPEKAELKPDLATDCLYTSATTYTCDLPAGLTFHNGHALTASDVKFSIERAYRLWTPRSSIRLFDSLARVEVTGDTKVTFHLNYADSSSATRWPPRRPASWTRSSTTRTPSVPTTRRWSARAATNW